MAGLWSDWELQLIVVVATSLVLVACCVADRMSRRKNEETPRPIIAAAAAALLLLSSAALTPVRVADEIIIYVPTPAEQRPAGLTDREWQLQLAMQKRIADRFQQER